MSTSSPLFATFGLPCVAILWVPATMSISLSSFLLGCPLTAHIQSAFPFFNASHEMRAFYAQCTNLIGRKVVKNRGREVLTHRLHTHTWSPRIETSSMPNIREILKHHVIIICLALLASKLYFREEPSAVQRSQRALDDVILLKPGGNYTVPCWCLCWSFLQLGRLMVWFLLETVLYLRRMSYARGYNLKCLGVKLIWKYVQKCQRRRLWIILWGLGGASVHLMQDRTSLPPKVNLMMHCEYEPL